MVLLIMRHLNGWHPMNVKVRGGKTNAKKRKLHNRMFNHFN